MLSFVTSKENAAIRYGKEGLTITTCLYKLRVEALDFLFHYFFNIIFYFGERMEFFDNRFIVR